MDIKFEQLVEIVSQLSEDMKEKLFESVIQKQKAKKLSKDEWQKLILKAPTWSDEQVEAQQNARKHIKTSRIA